MPFANAIPAHNHDAHARGPSYSRNTVPIYTGKSGKVWVEKMRKEEMQHHDDITGPVSLTRTDHREAIVAC
jgi:hypothetical protein